MSWPSGEPDRFGRYCSEDGGRIVECECEICGLVFGQPTPIPPTSVDFLASLRLLAIAELSSSPSSRDEGLEGAEGVRPPR